MIKKGTPTEQVFYSIYNLPLGEVYIASTEVGVCALFLQSDRVDNFLGWLKDHFGGDGLVHDQEYNKHVEKELQEYFEGQRKTFDLPLDLRGTEFQLRVWAELQQIPHGQTLTYKELACKVGGPNFCRAVGGANNKNPIGILVPCHRVIGSDGNLVGYAGGLEVKAQLLKLEQARLL